MALSAISILWQREGGRWSQGNSNRSNVAYTQCWLCWADGERPYQRALSLSLFRSLSLPSRYKISACLYAIWPTRAAGCAKLGGREETADCDGKEVQLQSSGLQTKFYGSNDAKNEFKLYENCIINGNSRGGRNQKQQHLFPHLRGPQQ